MSRQMFGRIVLGCAALCVLAGCTSQRIAIREKFGYAKREQLVDRVQDARDGQEKAKRQFESALKEFLAVTGAGGTDLKALEARYDKLKGEYERCEGRARDVRDRIQQVRQVAEALFKEWRGEIDQYTSDALRRQSERQLAETRRQYDRLLEVMLEAERRMPPVLGAFRDQVLFLKHNLNARAISSLQQNAAEIQTDVADLVREMEAAIAEANAFIAQMKGDSGLGARDSGLGARDSGLGARDWGFGDRGSGVAGDA